MIDRLYFDKGIHVESRKEVKEARRFRERVSNRVKKEIKLRHKAIKRLENAGLYVEKGLSKLKYKGYRDAIGFEVCDSLLVDYDKIAREHSAAAERYAFRLSCLSRKYGPGEHEDIKWTKSEVYNTDEALREKYGLSKKKGG